MGREVRLSLQSEIQQKIFRCFDEGMSSADIATSCGVSRKYVYDACEQSGRSFRARLQKVEASKRRLVVADWLDGVPIKEISRSRKICRQSIYNMIYRHRELDASRVPTWVPSSLHEQYRSIAYERGEPDAAAWARSVKKVAA